MKFAEEMFGHDTHWCREDDCENCPQLIEDFKKRQEQQIRQNMSEISAMSSEDSVSDSSEDEDFTPEPESTSSSSDSYSDLESSE